MTRDYRAEAIAAHKAQQQLDARMATDFKRHVVKSLRQLARHFEIVEFSFVDAVLTVVTRTGQTVEVSNSAVTRWLVDEYVYPIVWRFEEGRYT